MNFSMDGASLTMKLPQRQAECVLLAVRGKSNREIAKRLNLSHQTVKVHLKLAYQKLGVHTRAEAAALLQASSYTPIPDLTEQEREIVPFIQRGMTDKQISEELGIPYNLVRSRVRCLLLSLNARNRVEAQIKLRRHTPAMCDDVRKLITEPNQQWTEEQWQAYDRLNKLLSLGCACRGHPYTCWKHPVGCGCGWKEPEECDGTSTP